MRRISSPLRIALAFAGSLAAAGPAFAHAHLSRAVPPVGSTVSPAPTEVTLNFTEALEPHFSSIAVRNDTGERVDTAPLALAPGDGTRAFVPVRPLAPGLYHVEWHAVSVDTHRTEGHFDFTVAP
jgi:hypothetical protein